ncbi:MFS transporter [Dactylosporangium sp. NPDC050688]|uniref:MFS transporter n=1 Tax=Dactylosporangium sp. NPDC050688 TaxID=3157217 RepID=UPI0033C2C1C4
MKDTGRPTTHHHEFAEIINAATPSSSELPASIMTSGISGHEHVEPEYELGIPPPTEKAGLKLIVPFALAQMALFIALLGPVTVSMAIKVTAVVGADRAPSAQGLILGIGAIAALLGNPIFGRLSDRTTGRWGRRRPWMVGGSIGLAVCLFVIAVAGNVPTLIVAWFAAQLAANACFAAYLATIADQIPPRQSATVTALFAVGLVMLTQVDTVGGFYFVEAVLGAAYGIYMGVDLALVLAVLPRPEDNAKDLGVFNIANAMPQTLAPLLGAVLLGAGAGAGRNYDLLYLTAAALTFVGALAIIPVKKVP